MPDPDDIGYARATGPQQPTTIRTPADGLRAGRAPIPAGDRELPAYFAHPEGAADRPVVLVISEAFGLHEHIADIARRFAREGYFAVAPDLMVRQGDPLAFDDVGALVSELLLRIPDGQVMADLDATVEWAAARGARADHVAANGYCWGGRWTWLYAAHRRMDAAVAWYGIVDGRATFPDDPDRFPRHPLGVAADLRTPVLGLYGERDDAIPLATVEAMRGALADGSPPARASRVLTYPDAGHAFFADYRESYVPAAAEDAWQRCLRWLAERLGD